MSIYSSDHIVEGDAGLDRWIGDGDKRVGIPAKSIKLSLSSMVASVAEERERESEVRVRDEDEVGKEANKQQTFRHSLLPRDFTSSNFHFIVSLIIFGFTAVC